MPYGTDEVTAAFIRAHLDDDLEFVAASQPEDHPHIRPSLAPLVNAGGLMDLHSLVETGSENSPSGLLSFLLQVMSIKDVSLAREQRSRAVLHAVDLVGGAGAHVKEQGFKDEEDADMKTEADAVAAAADATLQAVEEQAEDAAQRNGPLRSSGGQWRCLRLELSDGFQRIIAVEDVSARTRQHNNNKIFAPNGLSLGAKLNIRLCASLRASVRHGVLRLHAGNADVLGGRVWALETFWAAQARQQLDFGTGRPSKRQPQFLENSPGSGRPAPGPQRSPGLGITNACANSIAAASSPTLAQQAVAADVRPLREWPAHAAQHASSEPFTTVAFITEVVSDMVINEPHNNRGNGTGCTYSLLVQLSAPDAVERDPLTQSQPGSGGGNQVDGVCAADHLVVDLGHAWLQQLVGMPAEAFRALSLSSNVDDSARLTHMVEAVGAALERFGRGRFTLVRRLADCMVEVAKVEMEG